MPELMKEMVASQSRGDHRAALKAQGRVQQAKELVKSGPVSAYYEIIRARGIDCGIPRPPMLPMDKEESAKMIASLRHFGLI